MVALLNFFAVAELELELELEPELGHYKSERQRGLGRGHLQEGDSDPLCLSGGKE